MSFPDEIAEIVSRVLRSKPFSTEKSQGEIRGLVEIPKDRRLGDYALPCFFLAKALRKAPAAIAEELRPITAEEISRVPQFKAVEAAGPYLNFSLDMTVLASELLTDIHSGKFMERRSSKRTRVMIEYSQPNTHKAFHVGHTRNVALGDALVRICEWVGYDVVAANYIGDVGAHIAKCLWYYENYFSGEVPKENRGEFLGDLYTKATEILDFTALTRAPHPGVITAKVLSMSEHPREPRWRVLEVDTGDGRQQVVCGGTGYEVGSVVPYARVGSQVAGRTVTQAAKAGVDSVGMVCSEKEVSLGDDRARIPVLPPETPLGVEIAEQFRIAGALAEDASIIEEMERRERGVSAVLRKLEAREPEITRLWEETRRWSLDEFQEIYRWLDARFDHYFYESDVGDLGKQIVQEYYEKGVFVLSDGAIGADLSRFKLPFFLLLKSDGTGLYSTKDLALARLKFEQFHVDRSVYVVDSSQSLHFQQVFRALELMGYERAKRCFHLAYGMVVLPEGKMSSRKGNIILFSQLKERLMDRIRREFLDAHQGDWSEDEIRHAAKLIALATIKYGMLNHDYNKNIVFDLTEWSSRTGNTGPYLMYAYTRTRSILREVGDTDRQNADLSLLTHDTEHSVLRRLLGFPNIVGDAAERYEPQLLCTYLYDLSRDFSRMYDQCSVLRAESAELQAARATLVEAVGLVLGKGLELLGIQTLERM